MVINSRDTHVKNQINDLLKWAEGQGSDANMSEIDNATITGLIGNTANDGIQEPCMEVHLSVNSFDSAIDVYDQSP